MPVSPAVERLALCPVLHRALPVPPILQMIHYGIETVPALLVLKPSGAAVAKSGKPLGATHMQQVLGTFVRLAGAQRD